MDFKEYLIEEKKQYKRGVLSHLSIMDHWANEISKLQNLPTSEHSDRSKKWFQRTNRPYTAESGEWSISTEHPSSKTAEADVIVDDKKEIRFGIEAKSGRPSLTSATINSTFEINPQSKVAKHIKDSLMSGRLKRMGNWLNKREKIESNTEAPTRRLLRMKKAETETHHPIVSEYENALYNSGIRAISITDGKGNIRHFSTNSEHEERLSKYVDVAHIQHKQGRLSLRIGQVTANGQTRKETQAISFLSKQQIGHTVKEIIDLNS